MLPASVGWGLSRPWVSLTWRMVIWTGWASPAASAGCEAAGPAAGCEAAGPVAGRVAGPGAAASAAARAAQGARLGITNKATATAQSTSFFILALRKCV